MNSSHYSQTPRRIRDLTGFGLRSEEILAAVGIVTVEGFLAADPYELYAELRSVAGVGLNMMYAIIGARENVPWVDVASGRKTEILMHLDDLGLAT